MRPVVLILVFLFSFSLSLPLLAQSLVDSSSSLPSSSSSSPTVSDATSVTSPSMATTGTSVLSAASGSASSTSSASPAPPSPSNGSYSLFSHIPTTKQVFGLASDGQCYYYTPTDATLGLIGVIDGSSSQELAFIDYTKGAFNVSDRPTASLLRADTQGHLYFFYRDVQSLYTQSIVTIDSSGKWLAQWTAPVGGWPYTPPRLFSFQVSRSGRRMVIQLDYLQNVYSVENGNITSLLYSLNPLYSGLDQAFWATPTFNDADELFIQAYNASTTQFMRFSDNGTLLSTVLLNRNPIATYDMVTALIVTGIDHLVYIHFLLTSISSTFICTRNMIDLTSQCSDTMNAMFYHYQGYAFTLGMSEEILIGGYREITVWSTTGTPPSPPDDDSSMTLIYIIGAAGVGVLVVVMAVVIYCCWKRRKARQMANENGNDERTSMKTSLLA